MSVTPAPLPLPVAIFRVFLPFAFGYFLSYIYRVINAVLAPDLVGELGLDASLLGLLTSVYFLTFAAFQLPLGILLDRYGPRRIEAALLVAAAVGAFLFATAESATHLVLARALIGFGVSACLMGAFKAYVVWFPKERLPMINGWQMAAGGFGALVGTAPVEMALGVTDWRGVFYGAAALTLLAAAILFFAVPEKEGAHPETTLKDQMRGVADVFTHPLFWRVAPITVLSQAAFLSVQGLWSGPWLRDVAGLSRAEAANDLFWVAAAMIAGFLVMGTLAERLSRVGVRPVTVALWGMAAFMVVMAALALEVPLMGEGSNRVPVLAFWMAFGFFGTTGIIPYAALSQNFPPQLAGRVNTGLNLLVFALAFVAQWALGIVIDIFPQGPDGAYAPEAYRAAFGLMVGLMVPCFAWYALYRRARFPDIVR